MMPVGGVDRRNTIIGLVRQAHQQREGGNDETRQLGRLVPNTCIVKPLINFVKNTGKFSTSCLMLNKCFQMFSDLAPAKVRVKPVVSLIAANKTVNGLLTAA